MKSTRSIFKLTLLLSLLLLLTACGSDVAAELNQPTATAIDPVAIFTSAAETVAAQLTQTAAAFSPTPQPPTETPIPQPTATLLVLDTPTALAGFPTSALASPIPTIASIVNTPDGPICDKMEYGSPVDITIPDGSTMKAGADFEKIWRIYNRGVCTWDDGYILVAVSVSSTRGAGDTNPLDSPNPAWKLNTLVAPGEAVDVGVKLTAPASVGTYSTCYMLQNDRGSYFGGPLCVEIVVKSD